MSIDGSRGNDCVDCVTACCMVECMRTSLCTIQPVLLVVAQPSLYYPEP